MANNSTKVKNSLVLNPVDLSTLVNPEPGDMACDINDGNKIKRYDSELSAWVEVGSGDGGGLDVFYSESVDKLPNTSIFNTGSSPFFAGGGTLAGTFELEEVEPISGTKSLKYTQAFGSSEDYFASEIIDIDPKQQGKTCGLTLYFNYDGNNGDGRFVVFDATNNQIISDQLALVENTGGQASRYSLSFTVPPSCNQIRWGYQVLVQNSGADLLVDDVEMTTDPFVEANLDNMTDWVSYTPTLNSLTGVASREFYWRRVGDTLEINGNITFNGTGAAGDLTISYPLGLKPDFDKIRDGSANSSAGYWQWYDDSASAPSRNGSVEVPNTTDIQFRRSDTSNVLESSSLTTNDRFNVFASIPIVGWSSSTENILTPSDTFSTDTAPLAYAPSSQYTLSTLENAPVGTFITFTYAANTNTRTQTNTAPTQTTADMNVNGINIFARAYNANSSAAQPAAVAIQIGKGFKGKSIELFKSTGKTTNGNLDWIINGISTESGLAFKDYDEKTGILYVDAGYARFANSSREFLFVDITAQNNGYLVINASRKLPLLAIPTPLVGYLKDVKPSGTPSGDFNQGAWQTRTLNVAEGDFNKFGTLSGNQFTLQPGTYEIEASAPAYQVSRHKIKLYNITDASDAILGSSEHSVSIAPYAQTNSFLKGALSISSTKVFELQHQCQSTLATNGFGVASNFGVNEVYAQVKITKLS